MLSTPAPRALPPADASTANARWLAVQRRLPGLALALAIGTAALWAAGLPALLHAQVSALTLAIVAGMVIGNTAGTRLPPAFTPGVLWTQRTLLRLGVMLYGLRLSFAQIGAVGFGALAIDVVIVVGTLVLAHLLGRRALGIDRDTTLLTGAGSAICGAAAVLAFDRVLKPDPGKAAIAVASVVLFGTLDIFVYPWLHAWLGFDAHAFGVFTGASVHEVAQVVAVGSAIDPATADVAVVVKLTRVMLLVPALLFFGWRQAKLARAAGDGAARMAMPWFALGFLAVSAFNSVVTLTPALKSALLAFDTLLLAAAMAALGLETRIARLRALGPKPLLLATLLWVWLVAAAALLVHLVG